MLICILFFRFNTLKGAAKDSASVNLLRLKALRGPNNVFLVSFGHRTDTIMNDFNTWEENLTMDTASSAIIFFWLRP